MKKSLLIYLLYFVTLPVVADELKGFDFKVPPNAVRSISSKAECKFDDLEIPKNAVVYAAGAYSGRKVPFQIDQSGHSATQFDVAVNSKKAPVILMLGAYEPTIWNIGWSKGTKIVAILVSGYHRQVVAGVEKKTPLLNSTHYNRGPCGYFYVGKAKNASLNPKSRRLFGQPVKLVYPGNKHGKILVGDDITDADRLVTSSKNTPKSYIDSKAPLAGKAGLNDAVSKGIIRKATRDDAQRWANERADREPKQDVPPVAGGRRRQSIPHVHNGYVVLKQFTYPAGLYGGNSATFFIEKGVPKPDGNPGHSRVYDFNTLTCDGALCGH